MEKSKVIELKNPAVVDSLTELLRTSARRIIAEAIEAKLAMFLTEVSQALPTGQSRVVRNGYFQSEKF